MDAEAFLVARMEAENERSAFSESNSPCPTLASIGVLAWLCRWGWPAVRIVALCDAQDVSVGTESYRLAKLCQANLLLREASSIDARMIYFSATKQGQLLLVRAYTRAFGHVKDVAKDEVLRRMTALAQACSLSLSVADVALLAVDMARPTLASDWGLRRMVDEGLATRLSHTNHKFSFTEEGKVRLSEVRRIVDEAPVDVPSSLPGRYLKPRA